MFPKYKTQVCFVSDQPLPNTLLAFSEETRPEKVYLLTSRAKENLAKTLKKTFQNMHVEVELIQLTSLSLKNLKDDIEELLVRLLDDENVAFNLTGGTKLMTLAAEKVCYGLGIPRFYVDTFSSTITMLNDDTEYPLSSYLTVRNILTNYGYRPMKAPHLGGEEASQWSGAIKYFLEMKKATDIAILNLAASKAENSQYMASLEVYPTTRHIFDECKKFGLLDFHISENSSSDTIFFASEEARRFCNGEWLEKHVATSLKQLMQDNVVHDYEFSLEIAFSDKKMVCEKERNPTNELDALFVRNNILYVVECKTSKMDNQNNVSNIIYKLDALRPRLGGVLAKGVLISYLPITPEEKERAEKANIIVIDQQKDIRNLRKELRAILEK